jgi:hypothetical protein
MILPMRPAPHEVPWVDLPRGYITASVQALQQEGLILESSWLDPSDPRDSTILLGDDALVWDEETGWRLGRYISGRQGERTVLGSAAHLGGDVLPAPRRLAEAVGRGTVLTPYTGPYRSYATRDGLDETFSQWPAGI